MDEPSKLLLKLSRQLFNESESQAFVAALTHPKPFHPCILWTQPKPAALPFEPEPPLRWQPAFVDRLGLSEKPGSHPLHHAGYYYCLDFSSVFAVSPLLTIAPPIQQAIDVCAAPGGKSLFTWAALHPPQMICNEAIGKRIGALVSNLKRCRVEGAIALNLDPAILAERYPETADLVLVDAPCTGQSLLAKGGKAPGCFHPVSINKNANRQKRILANAAQLVARHGHLVYMTCAYSPEENERVSEWFLQRFPQFQPIEVPHLQDWQSHLTDLPCYRMFPQSGLGAGAFTILLQRA